MNADAVKTLTTDALNRLAALLDAGYSDRLTALLKTMARFHKRAPSLKPSNPGGRGALRSDQEHVLPRDAGGARESGSVLRRGH